MRASSAGVSIARQLAGVAAEQPGQTLLRKALAPARDKAAVHSIRSEAHPTYDLPPAAGSAALGAHLRPDPFDCSLAGQFHTFRFVKVIAFVMNAIIVYKCCYRPLAG